MSAAVQSASAVNRRRSRFRPTRRRVLVVFPRSLVLLPSTIQNTLNLPVYHPFAGSQKMISRTKIPLICLTFLVSAAMSASVHADCNGRPCGVGPFRWLTPQGHKGADFRAACAQHDRCYSGGGCSRKACDDAFLANLLCECRNSSNPAACERRALRMYRKTRLFGGLFYRR